MECIFNPFDWNWNFLFFFFFKDDDDDDDDDDVRIIAHQRGARDGGFGVQRKRRRFPSVSQSRVPQSRAKQTTTRRSPRRPGS